MTHEGDRTGWRRCWARPGWLMIGAAGNAHAAAPKFSETMTIEHAQRADEKDKYTYWAAGAGLRGLAAGAGRSTSTV
ncbi:hypothetical protein ACRAWF_03150 [Streptomyces sp. L7]